MVLLSMFKLLYLLEQSLLKINMFQIATFKLPKLKFPLKIVKLTYAFAAVCVLSQLNEVNALSTSGYLKGEFES